MKISEEPTPGEPDSSPGLRRCGEPPGPPSPPACDGPFGVLPGGLFLLVLAGFLIRLAWSLVVPSWEGADEIAHYNFVRWVAVHSSLPVMPPDAWSVDRYEDYQAPLYYVVLAPFWRLGAWAWGSPPEILALLRVVTACLSLPLILLVHATARYLVPDRPGVPLAAAGVTAFLPMLAFNTATVNNDGLVSLACGAALLVMVRALARGRFGDLDGLALLLALVLGQYSKASALLMLPTTFLFALVLGIQTRDWRGSARALAVVFLCILCTAPLWLRSLHLYGDPLGVATVNASHSPVGTIPARVLRAGRVILVTWWANFGRLNELNAPWSAASLYLGRLNALFLGLTVLSLVGQVRRPGHLEPGRTSAWILATACGLLFLAADVYYQMRYGVAHGRFLFPVFAFWAVVLASGLGRLSGRSVAWWLPGFLLASTVYIWLRLIVPYYWDPTKQDLRYRGGLPPTGVIALGEAFPVAGWETTARWPLSPAAATSAARSGPPSSSIG